MNLPEGAPGLTAIIGTFPIPIELRLFNVVPDHSLLAFLSTNECISRQSHFPIFEYACEIEIGTVVIHPGLAPQFTFGVIDGKANSMQIRCVKILLNHL